MPQDQDAQAQAFQYSVKIERSAKGARWTVHCYSNKKETVLEESVKLYDDIGKRLEDQGLAVAPVEKGGRTE